MNEVVRKKECMFRGVWLYKIMLDDWAPCVVLVSPTQCLASSVTLFLDCYHPYQNSRSALYLLYFFFICLCIGPKRRLHTRDSGEIGKIGGLFFFLGAYKEIYPNKPQHTVRFGSQLGNVIVPREIIRRALCRT